MKGTLLILFLFAFLSCNAQTKDLENKVIGNWSSDMKDRSTGKSIGNMYIEFTKNGEFIQKTGEGKEQVASKMTYRLTKDKIYYKGKATSNKEFNSNYSFKGDILVIETGGDKSEYIRVK
ncbi:uncharacterized protein (TIGR03066 family) [Pedobacter sp. W3I1]|uniref:hypothetical protein n=1 Tax=Pedobacter sp. W3I1 TaxID=3042291 RepID=UPI002780E461|nr:hypothetical protein [Pedobacter sp. W3I1]MDQ0636513.1 uncharacterized protein (TIGR03066 family) [Pedobacter sp. W3I1]